MILIGIDCGLTGALAAIDQDGNILSIEDTPILTIGNKGKLRREYDSMAMYMLLQKFHPFNQRMNEVIVGIEKINPFPGEGVRSVFSMGRGLGIWEGLCTAFLFKIRFIQPQAWKKVMMDGMGKEKQASIYRAKQLFPGVDLILKKHHGRADALLIAEYLRKY